MKIALIPIDNRPVCYSLTKAIANIDKKLELYLPDWKYLGGLKSEADFNAILKWFEELKEVDAIVVSLDTIAYGGLFASRRSKDTFEEVKGRLEQFKALCKDKGKIYAVSSVMRISNNNVNEEEKEYWKDYGTKIFDYSYNFHKNFLDETEVPQEIMEDYLATRYRNFKINQMYLNWLEEGFFEKLVYSKDDCAKFGLNVMEARILGDKIKEKNLKACVKTGADEIPLTLFARAVCDYKTTRSENKKEAPKISLKFLAPEYKHLISNYEDIAIEESCKSQLELANCEITTEFDSDIVLIVNNFEEHQGEIVMGVKTEGFSGKLTLPEKSYMIADVRYANGADNRFIERFLQKKIDARFYGYSAWNTSANTVGSLICAGIVRLLADEYNEDAFKKLQLIRFLDDWAYQANIRQVLKNKSTAGNKENRPDFRKVSKLMEPFEKRLQRFLNIKAGTKYKFPWKRFFEIEVLIKDSIFPQL